MKIEWVVCVALLAKACAFVFDFDTENWLAEKKT